MQTSMLQVEEYFNCHLQRRSWQSLHNDTKQAAIKMAEDDIKLALGTNTLDIGDLLVFCAVCEQALFLAMREANRQIRPRKHGSLKSETIENLGKREYYDVPAVSESGNDLPAGVLAPRCELFLSRLPGYGSTIRIARG